MKTPISIYRNLSIRSTSILVFFFLLFFFTDGLYKILVRSGSVPIRIGPLFKGIFEFIILILLVLNLNLKKAYLLISILLLGVSFFIGQVLLIYNGIEIDFLENSNTFFKYLFLPLLGYFLINNRSPNHTQSTVYHSYKWVFTFNAFLMLLGLIFNLYYFKTYSSEFRFGYNGLIVAQNDSSYIFIIAISWVYYSRFYLKIRELFFWVVILSSIIVATKAVYVFLTLLFLFHILSRVSLKRILAVLSGIFVFMAIFFYSSIESILYNSWSVFKYNLERNGLFSALLSGRNDFLETRLIPLITNDWGVGNFLFGGQNVMTHYIEMGIFDVFLFFGLLGGIFYLWLMFSIFNMINFEPRFKLFFLSVFLFIIFLSGHFFESGIAAIHFIMIVLISKNYSYENYKKTIQHSVLPPLL